MDSLEQRMKRLHEQVRVQVGGEGLPMPRVRRVRRERVALTTVAVGLVAAVGFSGASMIGGERSQDVAGDGNWVAVATVEEARSADVLYVEEDQVFVVRKGDGFRALSAWSPHPGNSEVGHRMLFCTRAGIFQGGHGEAFDRYGLYYGGPAPRGMDRVPVRIRGGAVEIAPSAVAAGPPRHARKPLEPVGDICDGEGSPVEGALGFALEDQTQPKKEVSKKKAPKFESVSEAVTALEKYLGIPIPLPPGFEHAKVLNVHLGDYGLNARGGILRLRLPEDLLVFLDYGAAATWGCGNGPASPDRYVRVGSYQGVLRDLGFDIWSLHWPATRRNTAGLYGITSEVPRRRLMRWARSMTPAVDGEVTGKSGC